MRDIGRALKELEGRTAVLRFSDGEQVRARILTVDLEEHRDIIYDVLEVIVPGPATNVSTDQSWRTELETIESFEAAEQ